MNDLGKGTENDLQAREKYQEKHRNDNEHGRCATMYATNLSNAKHWLRHGNKDMDIR